MRIHILLVAFALVCTACGMDDIGARVSEVKITSESIPPSEVPPEVPLDPPEGEPLPPVVMTPPTQVSVVVNVNVTYNTYIRINGGVKGHCKIHNKGTIEFTSDSFPCGGANVNVFNLVLPVGYEFDLSTIFTSEDGQEIEVSRNHKIKT